MNVKKQEAVNKAADALKSISEDLIESEVFILLTAVILDDPNILQAYNIILGSKDDISKILLNLAIRNPKFSGAIKKAAKQLKNHEKEEKIKTQRKCI